MEIQITLQTETAGVPRPEIRKSLKKVLSDLGCHDKELSVLFTDDEHMARLNRQYRRRPGPTNVLAFPMADETGEDIGSPMLGDVVISVDTALKESRDLEEPIKKTINRLLIHGILHLLGFDHERSEAEARRMGEEEIRLRDLVA
jgi:rRNA maturation RNase YbeY